jgi:PhzF family phenazine biosynthesis protein
VRDSDIGIWWVDALTDRAGGGNPAAVCALSKPLAPAVMQAVAAELGLSETAFVEPPGSEGLRPLRWFTPSVEVDLCGHATLAAAHVLADASSSVRFATRSGEVAVARLGERGLELDFPAATVGEEASGEAGLAELAGALGETPVWAGRGGPDVLVELPSAAAVAECRPDLVAIARVDARAVAVFAAGDHVGGDLASADRATGGRATGGHDVDYVARLFAPQSGIDEDPATGSLQCALGPLWAGRTGHERFAMRQLSPRGAAMEVTVAGDRVRVAGRAVTVLRGRLDLDAFA